MSFNLNGDNSYVYVNRKEVFKFTANNRNVNFPSQLWLGSISNGFGATESREVSLTEIVYKFSLD